MGKVLVGLALLGLVSCNQSTTSTPADVAAGQEAATEAANDAAKDATEAAAAANAAAADATLEVEKLEDEQTEE